jgi:hypothetical protein
VAAVNTEKPKDSSSAGSSKIAVVPWVLIGAGAAMTVAGAVLIGLMVKDIALVKNMEGYYTPEQYATGEAAKDRVWIFSRVGIPLAGVGVASAAVGIFLLVSHNARGEQPATPGETVGSRALQLRVGLSSVSLSGSF